MSALEITTLIGCPLACTFCPQDALSRSYGTSSRMMSLDTFKKCIDKIPPHVRIDFSGMSEPFVNPNCIDFIKLTLTFFFKLQPPTLKMNKMSFLLILEIFI